VTIGVMGTMLYCSCRIHPLLCRIVWSTAHWRLQHFIHLLAALYLFDSTTGYDSCQRLVYCPGSATLQSPVADTALATAPAGFPFAFCTFPVLHVYLFGVAHMPQRYSCIRCATVFVGFAQGLACIIQVLITGEDEGCRDSDFVESSWPN
jgi:hypothetical protein